jgi:tRNA-modifying protein YgfZ
MTMADPPLVDRFGRGLVVVDGPDATSFLQSLVSQDLDPVADGEGVHSLLLQPQGKLVVDFRALRVGDGWWLDCEADFGPVLAATLGRYRIRVKAEIDDRSVATAMVSVRGAGADALVRDLVGGLPAADPHAHVLAGDLRVVRAPWPGVDGLDLLGPASALDALGWPAFQPDPFEAARIEHGVPRLGADVDDSTIAQEAFLERDAVSFTKGCFLGQELVCRIDTRGHVNRFLRGLRFTAPGALPPVGADVVAGAKVVGALTSVAAVPATTDAVALATVRREVEPPAEVTIRWDAGDTPATLTELPTP